MLLSLDLFHFNFIRQLSPRSFFKIEIQLNLIIQKKTVD